MQKFKINLLSDDEFDNLHYPRAKDSLGMAVMKTGDIYVRKTGIDIFDRWTLEHEIDEILNKHSEHEINGIRYKGKSTPSYSPPPPPKLPTTEELYARALPFGKSNFPLAFGARESALSDINNPAYYSRFQPTSLEQALSDQYFKNVWPETERDILQKLSMTGMEYSPITAATTGKAKGNLMTDIGEYLSNLGNTRATNSLQSRLNIDPYSTFSPYLGTDIGQTTGQANLDYQYAQEKAKTDFENAMTNYRQKQAKTSSLFGLGGAGIGAALAALMAIPTGGLSLAALPAILGAAGTGAGFGSSIGGLAAPLFGGSSGGGINIADAIALAGGIKGLDLGKSKPVDSTITGGVGGQIFDTSQFGRTWSPYGKNYR